MRKKNTFWHKLLLFTGFAGPAAFCFIMVMIVPFFYGIYLTLTGWNGISAVKDFVGLENYYTVFTEAEFWRSVLLTVIYSAISVVLVNVLAFALAYGVTGGGKSQNFFRFGVLILTNNSISCKKQFIYWAIKYSTNLKISICNNLLFCSKNSPRLPFPGRRGFAFIF